MSRLNIDIPKDFCKGCGLCCMHMRTPPHMPDEFDALPQELKTEIESYLDSSRYRFHFRNGEHDSPCIWLNLATGQCKHYDHRPGVCQDFEVGNQSCRTLRREVGLTIDGMPVVVED